ncbi:MAG: arginine deiminase [Bacteroidales bacterium]|jgi:arginine deiminase|nr:arginine deiminase [Bacteroidales bacterium]MBO7257064.1 arginine deiminase [Bacteroidales bacterium]MBO7284635.1 arginine deiminase [Bacteroidales bacterium]MBQ5747446.1 arginine deiminase [Bacteroidales bacterium]
MERKPLQIDIQSEIGQLNAVLLHTPGAEVENMTPKMAQRALYSDILNLSIAQEEYKQLSGVLSKIANVYTVTDLLVKVLENPVEREELVKKICVTENVMEYYETLMEMSSVRLAKALIEGLPARINTLTSFLNEDYYALFPLYNFYFTRDAAVTIGNHALICKMANKVRMRESLIMQAIYKGSGEFACGIIDAYDHSPLNPNLFMEGGDILIAREDVLLIGNGIRTSSQGIDFLASRLSAIAPQGRRHIIVQQLPHTPESFIHLDMVFTMLDRNKCMVFEPLILGDNQYQTIHIIIDNGKIVKISSVANMLTALKGLGMDLEPVVCGGKADEWDQEREQWHSGANFFAFAPGKVISYARNTHTLDELANHGFEIIPAWDVIEGRATIEGDKKCVVTVEGSELPRGGGGARCMTMPLSRKAVQW